MFILDLRDVEKAAADFEVMAEEIRRGMRGAVQQALRDGRGAARTAAPKKTHELENKIDDRIVSASGWSVIGIIESKAKHSIFVVRGTRPHAIVARGGALHWVDQAGDHFARRVWHPGTKPNDFMAAAIPYVEVRLEREMEGVVDRAVARFCGT